MEKETTLAGEAEVLKGENEITIQSSDGRIGSVDVLVNGVKQTFETGKQITVSDAQLDVLNNSAHTVEEVKPAKSKGKDSSDGEAGGGEGSPPPAAKGKKGAAKAETKAKPEPASNVDNGGNTTTSDTVKQAEEGKDS